MFNFVLEFHFMSLNNRICLIFTVLQWHYNKLLISSSSCQWLGSHEKLLKIYVFILKVIMENVIWLSVVAPVYPSASRSGKSFCGIEREKWIDKKNFFLHWSFQIMNQNVSRFINLKTQKKQREKFHFWGQCCKTFFVCDSRIFVLS